MCGIAGYIGQGSREILTKMIHTISHRGPDFLAVDVINQVGFAHARLSIVDLSENGHQPFYSADKRYSIVFNGEIYNFLELKKYLLSKYQINFKSTSDTEVLLNLYIHEGDSIFNKLNGMFALAIHDFDKNETIFVRDRLGKKPLYYSIQDKTIIFGSELKAVLAHPAVLKEVNFEALNEYLTFDYVPTPHTIIKGVFQLEAAHLMVFRAGEIIKKESFWEVNFEKTFTGNFDDAIQKLDYLLEDATKIRMIADVPLGVFLSGGLDSSTIAYYAQKNSIEKINTFSIGFENKSYDESSYAAQVANSLGTNHHVATLTAKDSLDLIPFISTKMDEPFADPSLLPTYLLSKFTKSKVTVALGGDGSDELLAGYPTFVSDRFKGFYQAVPQFLKNIIQSGTNLLPPSDSNISLDFKINQFLKGFEDKSQYTHSLWLGSFTPRAKKQLFQKSVYENLKDKNGLGLVDFYLNDFSKEADIDQIILIYLKTYLKNDILVKVDRASMYASLEVRAPFLDYRVVEFLNTLPKNYKILGNNGKLVLKELMRRKLPDDIIDRPKKGFGIPLSLWIRNELKELCEETLSEENINKQGYFDYKYIKKLKEEHFSMRKNNRKELWNLMVFQIWHQNFIG